MYTVKCLNPIASKGLDLFTEDFKVIDDLDKADAVLVRSAAMHDLAVPESLLAGARAGAGDWLRAVQPQRPAHYPE